MTYDPDDWLEIGTVVAPQGLKGDMRVYPNTDFPERFLEPGERWLLRPGGAEPESMMLCSGRFLAGKGLYVIRLAGITDRDQVETLRNSRLLVPVSDRLPLDEGEYHVLDLVGLLVYQQITGELVGIVRDVLSAGNDLLEVELLLQETSCTISEVSELAISGESETSTSTTKHRTSRKKVHTALIPFVEAIVPTVDLENKRIEILPPPGLIPEGFQMSKEH